MMLNALTYEPYEDMSVKDHVFKLEFLFVFVLVDECSFKLTFLPYVELLDLDLLSINDAVLRHSLEDRLLCTPVDCELLVPLVLLQVVDLVL